MTLSSGGGPASVRIEGSIREVGDGVPDLHATIRSEDRTLELLRLGGRIWVRLGPQDEWTPTPQTPEDAIGLPTTDLAALVGALEEGSVDASGDGWTVTGSLPGRTVGLPGEGRVEVVLVLDPDAELTSYTYSTELRAPTEGGERRVELEVRTELTAVGEAVELPTPPPG